MDPNSSKKETLNVPGGHGFLSSGAATLPDYDGPANFTAAWSQQHQGTAGGVAIGSHVGAPSDSFVATQLPPAGSHMQLNPQTAHSFHSSTGPAGDKYHSAPNHYQPAAHSSFGLVPESGPVSSASSQQLFSCISQLDQQFPYGVLQARGASATIPHPIGVESVQPPSVHPMMYHAGMHGNSAHMSHHPQMVQHKPAGHHAAVPQYPSSEIAQHHGQDRDLLHFRQQQLSLAQHQQAMQHPHMAAHLMYQQHPYYGATATSYYHYPMIPARSYQQQQLPAMHPYQQQQMLAMAGHLQAPLHHQLSPAQQLQVTTPAPAPAPDPANVNHSGSAKPQPEAQQRSQPARNRGKASESTVTHLRDLVDSEDDEDDDEHRGRKRKRKNWTALGVPLITEALSDVHVVDRVLDDKFDPPDSQDLAHRLFYIKWLHRAHIYDSWEPYDRLRSLKGIKKVDNYIKNTARWAQMRQTASPEDIEAFEVQRELEREQIEEYRIVDRIVAHRNLDGQSVEYLVKWCKLSYSEATWEPAHQLQGFQRQIDRYIFRQQQAGTCVNYYYSQRYSNPVRPEFQVLNTQRPPFLRGGDLRDYQVQGVNWLIYSWCNNTNCILADEMGLGKTIQGIAFLGYLQHVASIPGPFLVVVPLSTLANWEAEFEKWLPDCNVVVYSGDSKSRAIIQEYEFFMPSADGSAPNPASSAPKFNVLLTTFEIVLKDRDVLSQIRWNQLMVDEAHRLKNADSALHDVLDGFSTGPRLLITGTPLQNSLKELWALMHFIEPKKFPAFSAFETKYGQISHEAQIAQLHAELKPHLLRRLKKDVEKSLPAKNERILRVPLSPLQRQYYRWVLTRNFKELNKGLNGQSATTLSNIMIELKKVCNHPYLFTNAEEAHGKAANPNISPQEALIANSGKMVLLDRLLQRLHSTGHRVLIFSQMVRMLDLLADYLRFRGYQFQRLDGSSTRIERQRAMESFNNEGSRDFCFLLSTRAGGLGINLSTADTVIIFDSDWNPQNDLQAEARAHRIGQKNVVSIYRLVSQNSVEENILARAKKKLALDQLVIQRLNSGKNGPHHHSHQAAEQTVGAGVLAHPVGTTLSALGTQWQKSELAEVIRFGAQEIFKSENDKMAEYELISMNIEEILATSEATSSVGGPSDTDILDAFKFAEFKAREDAPSSNLSGTTSLANSIASYDNFWESVIPPEERARLDEEEEARKQSAITLGPRRSRSAKYSTPDYECKRQPDALVDEFAPSPKKMKIEETSAWPAPAPEDAEINTGNDSNAIAVPFSGGHGSGMDTKEVRKMFLTLRTVGDLSRKDALVAASGLQNTMPSEKIMDIYHEIVQESRNALASVAPEERKRVTLVYQQQPISIHLLLSRLDEIQTLKDVMSVYSDPFNQFSLNHLKTLKPWKVGLRYGWKTPDDDRTLLLAVYFHGSGNLNAVHDDPRFASLAKILQAAGSKLQSAQLLSRFETVMKLLRANWNDNGSARRSSPPSSPRHIQHHQPQQAHTYMTIQEHHNAAHMYGQGYAERQSAPNAHMGINSAQGAEWYGHHADHNGSNYRQTAHQQELAYNGEQNHHVHHLYEQQQSSFAPPYDPNM